MKPVVLLAQVKELQNYIKEIKDIDKNNLVEISKKIVKIQTEVNENLEKLWSFFLPFSSRFVGKTIQQKRSFVEKGPGMIYDDHIIVSGLSWFQFNNGYFFYKLLINF